MLVLLGNKNEHATKPQICYYPYMTSRDQDQRRKELGRKLRQVRAQKANLTQQEVADAAGMHVNYYARIERGEENPSFEKLQSIMEVLHIKSLDLL